MTTFGKLRLNREDGGQYLLNLFERTIEDELIGLENKVATYLDRQELLILVVPEPLAQGLLLAGMVACERI